MGGSAGITVVESIVQENKRIGQALKSASP